MPKNNMPKNWQPPALAWQADWNNSEDPLVVGYFGIQASSPERLERWANQALVGEHAPEKIDQGMYTDKAKVKNYLYIAYWRNSVYQQWLNRDDTVSWWASDDRLNEGIGYWREIIAMPFERFETLNSSTQPHGVSVVANELEGPIQEHGYAGGMRDRIPLSENNNLKNSQVISEANQSLQVASQHFSDGKRVIVTPPENTCVIRSGQNWSDCIDEQASFYLDKVHPVLIKGMKFLQNNPIDTQCYSMRFVDTKTECWNNTSQSFGLGYAADIYAFENWAKTHPTHLAILDRFMNMVMTFGESLQLKLWHEVIVLPKDGCEFEYINCHAETGLLSYA